MASELFDFGTLVGHRPARLEWHPAVLVGVHDQRCDDLVTPASWVR
jgi:hypothetical protein